VTGGGGVDAGKTAPGEDRPVPIDRDCVLSVGVAPLRDAGGLRHGTEGYSGRSAVHILIISPCI